MVCVKLSRLWAIQIVGLFSLLMAGCTATSTQLVRSWQEPAFTDKPLKEILILGAFQDDNHRRLYEDGVAKALARVNHTAVTSYSVAPDPLYLDEKEEIRALVTKTHADAVMIATLVSVDKEKAYVQPTVSYVPMMGAGGTMTDYYHFSTQAVITPGHFVSNTMVNLEITVFSVKTEKMIWAGATQSFNPKTRERLVDEAAGLIIKDMEKSGLL